MILLTILLAACSLLVCACGDGHSAEPPTGSLTFDGATLNDAEFTYDGQSHSLEVSGTLPQNTQITYTGNGKTDVGEYTVTATLTNPNYVTKVLSAKLTVNRAEFTGITLTDKSVVYSGEAQSLFINGTLPQNTEITYTGNGKIDIGEYTVTATLTNPNYVTKVLSAKLTIIGKMEIALSIVNALLDKPEPWSFLPSAFLPEKMAHATQPVGGLDGFAADVPVSLISKKHIGKQFYVLYEGLADTTQVLNAADTVFNIGGMIADVYQTFINNNPDNYAEFVGEAGGFKIKIVLDGDNSTMLVGNSALNVELHYSSQTKERIGRIQLTNNFAIKYTANETSLKLAVRTTVADVGNIKQIEFVRNGNTVTGYSREFTGNENKNLKTSGVISSNAQTTCIMSDKRETDDLKIDGYEEVYSSVTGEFIGGRVLETIKICDYDTTWFNLNDISGFTSVRVKDDSNGTNADSFFVNGQSATFEPKNVGGIGLAMASRRFDIEMKDVRYIVAQTNNGKTEYTSVKTSVPMLFVQTEYIDTFPADVKEKNSYIATTSLPNNNIASVNAIFNNLKALFDTVKSEVTYNDIQTYIGSKNTFFDTVKSNRQGV